MDNNEEEIEELFEEEKNDENNPLYLKDKLENIEEMNYHKEEKIPSHKSSNGMPFNPKNKSSNKKDDNNKNNLVNNKNNQLNNLKNNKLNKDNINRSNSSSDIQKLNSIRKNNANAYNNLQASRLNQRKRQQQETDENNSNSPIGNIKNKAKGSFLKAFGVPSSLADNLSKSTNFDKQNFAAPLTVTMPVKFMIGILAVIFIIVIIIVISVAGVTNQDDESELNSNATVKNYIIGTATEDELTDTLVYMNLCLNNDSDVRKKECLNSPAGKYFTHLKEIYNDYQKYEDKNGEPIKLNIDLLLETQSYGISDMELFSDENVDKLLKDADDLAEAQVELYQEYGDLYKSSGNSCSVSSDKIVLGTNGEESYYRISNDKYISYLLYGKVHENYKGEIRKLDVDIHPDSSADCIPNGRKYDSKDDTLDTTYDGDTKNGYIYTNISSDYNIDEEKFLTTNKEIVIEIYERANQNLNSGLTNIAINCPGVVVTGNYAGVYSLEEYVAGVVQNENSWYQGNNIESMKAQAVAARTYVLRVTNNCSLPIENSASKQTMNPNYSSQAKRAAEETAGQVLVNSSGNYISTEYDAFCYSSKDSKYYTIQAGVKIPTDWVESNIKTWTYKNCQCELKDESNDRCWGTNSKGNRVWLDGGHGRGMSQWGSRYLQTQGYTYDKILSTFYSSAQISTPGNNIVSDIPNNINDLKNRYYFNFDISSYRGNTLFGQCVWYAKHRAMEIIASSDISESQKQVLINSIRNTRGNGQDWYQNPDGNLFKKTRDINAPKAGSIISWTRGTYGHVAIVEAVKTNAKGEIVVTISEGWRQKGSNGDWYVTDDLWSVVRMSKKDYTIEQLRRKDGTFNGYVYLY